VGAVQAIPAAQNVYNSQTVLLAGILDALEFQERNIYWNS